MITGSLPFQSSHVFGFVANSHMKCATLAMLVLSGAKRLLTRPSCSVYSETSPSRSVSGRTAAHLHERIARPDAPMEEVRGSLVVPGRRDAGRGAST